MPSQPRLIHKAGSLPTCPPPTCPLPPIPTVGRPKVAKRAQDVNFQQVQLEVPPWPIYVPGGPAPEPFRWDLLKPIPEPTPAVPKLPQGYDFFPPPQPLNYPETYRLIAAGPHNAAPKPKRAIFATITNLAARARSATAKK